MKTTILRVGLFFFITSFLLCPGLVQAEGYDQVQCKKYVNKLYKLVKPYKDLKFKSLLVTISKMDDVEGGTEAEELEDAVEVPFEDVSWAKKFVKYLNNVEEFCAK